MKTLTLISVCFVCSFGYGQSSRIDSLSLVLTTTNQVIVRWTMNAGSTCQSLEVQRGLNESSMQTVYDYPSVCGSSDSATAYQWIDRSPNKYQQNYYRLLIEGGEYTLLKVIDVQSRLKESEVIIFPNPVRKELSLELRNEQALKFDVRIYNSQGLLLSSIENLNGKTFSYNVEHLKASVYSLTVEFENKTSITKSFIVY